MSGAPAATPDAVKPADKDAKASTKPAGGNMNVVVLALVGTNLLGMMGLGAYMVMSSGSSSAPAEHEAEHEDDDEGEEHTLGPLVEVETIIVNLADPGQHYLKMTAQFELDAAPEALEHVESHMVPIRDRVLSYLSSLVVAQVTGGERREEVRAELVRIANEALGEEDMVRNVYFTEYLVQ